MYRVLHAVVPPLLRAVWRPTVTGAENVPRTGGVLLASNHLSFADSIVIPSVTPRPVHFLAKSDYFTGTGLKGAAQRAWFEGMGMLPVDRDDPQAALGSLEVALEVLNKGEAFGIYPEGTRSPDGRLYKGKTGLARMALESGVKVIPVAMIGTEKVNPIGSRVWRPSKVTIRVGEPIDFSRFEGMGGNRFVERAVTDEVMYKLMKLSGQEYVDIYAATLKKKAPAADASVADVAPASDATTVTRLPDTRAS